MNAIRFIDSGVTTLTPALVSLTPYRVFTVQRGGLTGDGTNIFIGNRSAFQSGGRFWVDRRSVDGNGNLLPAGSFPLDPATSTVGQIDGLAARNGFLYVSAEHKGPIHVHRASDLSEVTRLHAGREMNGVIFWYDIIDLMRATRRSNGEYLSPPAAPTAAL